ncbi:MAG: hypothetical protein ABL984_07925 [Pyrinomonadaceae bacterium]
MRTLWMVLAVAVLGFACTDYPMLTVREGLCQIRPVSDEPDPSLPVAGKVAVVYRNANFEYGKFGSCELDGYSGVAKTEPKYQPPDRYADSPEQVDTVVLIETQKGQFIDKAEAQRTLSTKTETSVFAGNTTISLIDRQTGKLARRVSFSTRNFPQQVPQQRLKLVDGSRYEYVCEPTVEEVRENLGRFFN